MNQATHVVGEVLETYARPRPYKSDAANQQPAPDPVSSTGQALIRGAAHVVGLRPEDMLDACPKARTTLVARLLPIMQRTVAIALAMNPTPQAPLPDLFLNVFRPIGAVRPHTACRVVRRKHLLKHLAVMDCRVRHVVTPDQLVLAVDAHVVLVAIMTLAVLAHPCPFADL